MVSDQPKTPKRKSPSSTSSSNGIQARTEGPPGTSSDVPASNPKPPLKVAKTQPGVPIKVSFSPSATDVPAPTDQNKSGHDLSAPIPTKTGTVLVPSSATTALPGTSAPLITPGIPSISSNGISSEIPPPTTTGQATGQDEDSSSSSSSAPVINNPKMMEREQLMKAYWKTTAINKLELKFNKTSFLRFAKDAEDVIFADLFKSFNNHSDKINKLENERSIFEKTLAEAKLTFSQADNEVRDMRERFFGEASLRISYAEQRLHLDEYTKWFKVAEKAEKVIENAATELKKTQGDLERATKDWNQVEEEMNESQMELQKLTTIENIVRDVMKKLRDGEVEVIYSPHGMKKHIMKFKALVKKLLMMEPDGKYSKEEESIIKESIKDSEFTIASLLAPIKESQKRAWIEEWNDESPEAKKPKIEENSE